MNIEWTALNVIICLIDESVKSTVKAFLTYIVYYCFQTIDSTVY